MKNNATESKNLLPDLTQKILNDPLMPVDNLLTKLWKKLGIKSIYCQAGFHKRSGVDVSTVVYLLLAWNLLKLPSINLFSRECLEQFADAHKDALYDFIKCEDLNWRKPHTKIAKKVYKELNQSQIKAFVADDTVRSRRGKKTEGVSLHYDHLTSRTIKGQQILTLGMATEEAFIPLEQEIFIGTKKIQPATFKDSRHHAAKRYQQSLELTKPALLALSLKRAINNGFDADYFLADAWFGNKSTLRLTEDCSLTAILRMKKDKTKYKVKVSEEKHKLLNSEEIYRQYIRNKWTKSDKIKGYFHKAFNVEINLAKTKKEPDQWVKVRLLFVKRYDENTPQSKQTWALFLTTEPQLEAQRILEIYALRWGIEVYFKEAKQHLGLLKEQTISYASHLASLSLTATRYLLLLYSALENKEPFCDSRNKSMAGLQHLDFGKRLWAVFRVLIIESIQSLGDTGEEIIQLIEENINAFFIQALQLDVLNE